MPQEQTIRAPEMYFNTCYRNIPYYLQKCVLTYATKAERKVYRSAWGHMPQKQTKTFPEAYADIHHRNRA
jgi:hypothetical protein